jgi:hypothetical protein
VNHAVVLTGWDDSTQSWVLRNSWGSGWGESGYMRIRWGISNVGYAANYVVYQGSGATITPGGPTLTPTLTPTPTPTNPPVSNDTFENATTISLSVNATNLTQNISNATTAADDPIFTCASRSGYKSVWFKFIPDQSGLINLDTIGSNYDTLLGIWQGSRGSLASIACNDDGGGNYASKLQSISISSGQTYIIEVASYGSISSGLLSLNLVFVPPTPTPTPAAPTTPIKSSPANGALINSNSPEFTWQESSFATEYEFQYDRESTFASPIDYSINEAINSIYLSGVSDGKIYWRVRARSTGSKTYWARRCIFLRTTPRRSWRTRSRMTAARRCRIPTRLSPPRTRAGAWSN